MKNNGEATGEFADDSKMPEERVISLGSKMYNGDCIENLNLRFLLVWPRSSGLQPRRSHPAVSSGLL